MLIGKQYLVVYKKPLIQVMRIRGGALELLTDILVWWEKQTCLLIWRRFCCSAEIYNKDKVDIYLKQWHPSFRWPLSRVWDFLLTQVVHYAPDNSLPDLNWSCASSLMISLSIGFKKRAGAYYLVYKLEAKPRVFTPDNTWLRFFWTASAKSHIDQLIIALILRFGIILV